MVTVDRALVELAKLYLQVQVLQEQLATLQAENEKLKAGNVAAQSEK